MTSKSTLLVAGLVALFTPGAFADTLTASPATCASVTGVGSVTWSNPGRATASDNNRAAATLGSNATSNYLRCLNYGFSGIPATAGIDGITVSIERRSSSTTATVPRDAVVYLVKNGAIGGANRATTTIYTTADVIETHGGTSDLWDESWTPADLKSATFGVAYAASIPGTATGGRTVSVDHISVTVEYSLPRSCVSAASGPWSSASTWNCGSGVGNGPPKAIDSATINTPHVVSLDTSPTVTALTINSGSLHQAGSVSRTLTVTGDLVNSGTIADSGNSGSLNVSVGGNLTGNGGAITVDSLNVARDTTVSNPLTVNGAFSTTGNLTNSSTTLTVGTLTFQKAGTQAASFSGSATTIGNLIVNNGSTVSSTDYSTINLKGTLTNNGTISLPNTSWLFNGTSAQNIAGTSPTTLGQLTMNNPSGLILGANTTVAGTLTLNNGIVNTGGYLLTSTANCPTSISGGGSSSYVNGQLRLTYPAWNVSCTYPVGDSAYAPITVTVPWFTGIAGGTLTGSTVGSEFPQTITSGIDTYLDVNRYWTLGASGDTMATLPSGGSYSVALGFAAGDIDTGATVANFKVGKYNGSSWATLAGSASGTTATLTGQTTFGTYAVGTPLLPVGLTKTASSAAVAVGSYATFTVTVNNTNATALTNVVVTDVIPSSMTFQGYAATSGTATVAATVPAPGQTLTWTIPAMAIGESAQLTLVVQPNTQGTYTNTVTSGRVSASTSILVLPNSFVHYRMDETVGSWTTTTSPGSVIDSGVNGLAGHLRTTATPTTTNVASPTPTIASQRPSVVGGFCNAGNFDGKAVVETPYSPFFQFTQRLSASAWIYPTGNSYTPSGGDLSSILSNDTNYEFHLDANGHLYWWWNASSLTSSQVIPRNQWTHIAITMDSSASGGRELIYINGVADTNTGNWKGTLQANACPFYIGGDITTGASCALIPGRNFQGKIDEVKIYDYELSAAEVQADMNLGRQCGATFDHIRIEHDGTASTCTPKTVTVKACLNASCTALYPGPVQVTLTPSGWSTGNTITINGVGTATLNNSAISVPTLTLGGTAYGSTLPTNTAARCFNGLSETCTLNVASTSCAFDAVEPGAAPRTRLFTKLAGTAFDVDVLALSNSTTINQVYTGSVTVDLVDTSTSACSSTSTVISTAQQTVVFDTGDRGRKRTTLTCDRATSSAQVRIKSGTAYACSYDKLAVRPSQFTVTSSMSNTALTGTPKATAGSAFTLTANGGVAAGYGGTPTLDSSKVVDHNGDPIASGTLSGVFAAGTGASAIGTAFKYLDVGNIQLNQNAVIDSTFTSVDQNSDCIAGSTSNTLSGGKYGCNIGSVASARFGRWYPSHYSFAGALAPACVAGGFTYMDQDNLSVALSIRAHATTGAAAAATDPVLSRYHYDAAPARNYPALADVTFAGDNGGVPVAADRLASPAFPALPTANKPLWQRGQLQINDSYAFAKLAQPDGPFDTFRLMAMVNDTVDGPANLIGTIAERETNTTRVRFGRVRLGNAYGSELLNLPLDLRIQFWAGAALGWRNNNLDTCTAIQASDFAFSAAAGGNLAPCETAIVFAGAAPNYTASLLAPGAGNAGWTNVTLNLGATPTGNQCAVKSAGIGPAATSANAPWLQFNWAGTGAVDPSAHVTFGVYRTGPVIHRREMY